MFLYIGELCRYLVQRAAASEGERSTGSGWPAATACGPTSGRDFKTRFRIPQILEFYAATEGNVSMFNFDGTPGAIGRMPRLVAQRLPDRGRALRHRAARQPVRGADGFCIECAPDEVGEVIGADRQRPVKPGQRFEGYADKAATEKKILRDVFEKGDPGSAPAT